MSRLPVSGAFYDLGEPDGRAEMLVAESSTGALQIACDLLTCTAVLEDSAISPSSLCITDFECLLLTLRARWYGQSMALVLTCPHCNQLAEMQFRVSKILELARPRDFAGVAPVSDRDGWYSLEGGTFRLPTVGALIEASRDARPARALELTCLDETARRPGLKRRIERAMELMAPEVSRKISGSCPSCQTKVDAHFAVVGVVISEMKRAVRDLHDEVDLIARAYHWPQSEILSLPQDRRKAYVERIRRAEAA